MTESAADAVRIHAPEFTGAVNGSRCGFVCAAPFAIR